MHSQKCPTRGPRALQEHMDLHARHLHTRMQIEHICTLGDGWQPPVHACSKALSMACCKRALCTHAQSWRGICSNAAWNLLGCCWGGSSMAPNLSLGDYPGRDGNRSPLQQQNVRERQGIAHERARRCVPELCVLLFIFFWWDLGEIQGEKGLRNDCQDEKMLWGGESCAEPYHQQCACDP